MTTKRVNLLPICLIILSKLNKKFTISAISYFKIRRSLKSWSSLSFTILGSYPKETSKSSKDLLYVFCEFVPCTVNDVTKPSHKDFPSKEVISAKCLAHLKDLEKKESSLPTTSSETKAIAKVTEEEINKDEDDET